MILNSYDLVNEVSDEKRFYKKVSRGLLQVRNAVGDALFTVCIDSRYMRPNISVDHSGYRLMPRVNKIGISHVRLTFPFLHLSV